MSEKNRKWSPYRYAYDNPLRFIDPDGMTEEERNKAAERMLEHKKEVTKHGDWDKNVKPGGTSDCIGTVSESIKFAGEVDPNHGNENGVTNLVNNTERIDDVTKAEKGYAVVTDNNGHTGLLTNVIKDKDGNATTLEFTHNEDKWSTKNSKGVVIASGGGEVVTSTIRVNMIGKTKSEGATKYERTFGGLYKWDDLPRNTK